MNEKIYLKNLTRKEILENLYNDVEIWTDEFSEEYDYLNKHFEVSSHGNFFRKEFVDINGKKQKSRLRNASTKIEWFSIKDYYKNSYRINLSKLVYDCFNQSPDPFLKVKAGNIDYYGDNRFHFKNLEVIKLCPSDDKTMEEDILNLIRSCKEEKSKEDIIKSENIRNLNILNDGYNISYEGSVIRYIISELIKNTEHPEFKYIYYLYHKYIKKNKYNKPIKNDKKYFILKSTYKNKPTINIVVDRGEETLKLPNIKKEDSKYEETISHKQENTKVCVIKIGCTYLRFLLSQNKVHMTLVKTLEEAEIFQLNDNRLRDLIKLTNGELVEIELK